MAYTKEFREKALDYCAKGHADSEIGYKMGVHPITIKKWKKQLFDTGSLERKERKAGKPYKYKPEKIKEMLDKSRDNKHKSIEIYIGNDDKKPGTKKPFDLTKPKPKKKKKKLQP